MLGLYLIAIVISFAGMIVIDRTWHLGVVGRRLLVAVAVVELAFLLVFDVIGAWRGWFASSSDWVVVIVPPGIPIEEPLLLAFLASFTLVVQALARRWLREGEDA
jgi:hypothetical protein